MARPTNKDELLAAAARNYEKLGDFIGSMSELELATPFDFSADKGKAEAHWHREGTCVTC